MLINRGLLGQRMYHPKEVEIRPLVQRTIRNENWAMIFRPARHGSRPSSSGSAIDFDTSPLARLKSYNLEVFASVDVPLSALNLHGLTQALFGRNIVVYLSKKNKKKKKKKMNLWSAY